MSEGVLGLWHAAPVVRTPTNKGGAKRWAIAALRRVDGGGAYTPDSAIAAGGLRGMACACDSAVRMLVVEENERLRRDVASLRAEVTGAAVREHRLQRRIAELEALRPIPSLVFIIRHGCLYYALFVVRAVFWGQDSTLALYL